LKLPAQLLQQLDGILGFDEAAFLQAHERVAPVSIRLHPLKHNLSLPVAGEVPWVAHGRYLTHRPVFTLDAAFHTGSYYVQEASSMFLEQAFAAIYPTPQPIRVLDLCGAPGGKSTHIASVISPDSLLISNEVIRARATILEENMTRWGQMNTWVSCNDPRDFTWLRGYFDLVVVDAPCSGSGLFRKDERALLEWSTDNVAMCADRQRRIVKDIWPSIRQGGYLIYATCSYSPAENEQMLDWMQSEFNMQSIAIPFEERWGVLETKSPMNGLLGYRFFPHLAQGEGFFIAVIQKLEEEKSIERPKTRRADTKLTSQTADLLTTDAHAVVPFDKEQFTAIHPQHEADWNLFQKKLYFRKAGSMLGTPAQKEWIPAHDVALSVHLSKQQPTLALSAEQALKYLKREALNHEGLSKGWHVVTYNGYGLGWAKVLQNRVNNYLPKHLRIRMQLPDEE
jgi:16S rRNA C967 or C1407 C5-methylase (RsmB/RsmF family)/NOL1/NOP2/fmu family ribosome biogenesis protein